MEYTFGGDPIDIVGYRPRAHEIAAALEQERLATPYVNANPEASAAPAGIISLNQQTASPISQAVQTAPVVAPIAPGKFVTDYQGNKFDAGTTLNLSKQIANAFDRNSSGTAFTTKGESIGFDYNQAKEILGNDPNAIQQVMFDMARYLQQAGVTDLNQIGVRQSEIPYYNEQGNIDGYTQGREFYNKETGQAIQEQFGQTYTGKGGTAYFLTEKDGKVGVKAKGFDTSDAGLAAPLLMAASFMMPVIAPGLQSAIASAVPAAGAAGSLGNVALTNALTSGAMAGLMGGDPLKAALLGGATPFISSGIGSVLPTDFVKSNPAIAKFLTSAGTSAVTGALSGRDFDLGQSLQNSLMGGIAGTALGKAGIPSELAPILVSLAKSGTITPQTVMQMMSQMSAKKGT